MVPSTRLAAAVRGKSCGGLEKPNKYACRFAGEVRKTCELGHSLQKTRETTNTVFVGFAFGHAHIALDSFCIISVLVSYFFISIGRRCFLRTVLFSFVLRAFHSHCFFVLSTRTVRHAVQYCALFAIYCLWSATFSTSSPVANKATAVDGRTVAIKLARKIGDLVASSEFLQRRSPGQKTPTNPARFAEVP